jgi:hypothetical protein
MSEQPRPKPWPAGAAKYARLALGFDPDTEIRTDYWLEKRGLREAALDERAAVVSWLRTQRSGWTTRVLDILADAIEAGEHCNTHTHRE